MSLLDKSSSISIDKLIYYGIVSSIDKEITNIQDTITLLRKESDDLLVKLYNEQKVKVPTLSKPTTLDFTQGTLTLTDNKFNKYVFDSKNSPIIKKYIEYIDYIYIYEKYSIFLKNVNIEKEVYKYLLENLNRECSPSFIKVSIATILNQMILRNKPTIKLT